MHYRDRLRIVTLRRYTPDDLLAKYRAIRDAASVEDFFRKPEHQKTQELWCAAHFGRAYAHHFEPACMLDVDDVDRQTDVDFELVLPKGVHPFQVTEVQAPGRRRGDEYSSGTAVNPTPHEHSKGSMLGPVWILEALERKVTRYGKVSRLNLLVYANFPAWNLQYDDICRAVQGVAEKFASVWLMSGNAVCCLHKNPSLAFVNGWMMVPESLDYDEP